MGHRLRLLSRTLLFGGGLLIVVGGALPWVVVDGFGGRVVVSGVAAFSRISPVFSGVVTALLAAMVVLLALDDRPSTVAAAAVLGLVVAALAGVYVVDPAVAYGRGQAGRLTAELTTADTGVYLTVLAGGAVLVGGVTGVVAASRTAER